MKKITTLQQFLDLVAQGQWTLDDDGYIRARRACDENGHRCCPISWAYQKLTRKKANNSLPVRYGEMLGLRLGLLTVVVAAADHSVRDLKQSCGEIRKALPFRRRLLKACKLQETV